MDDSAPEISTNPVPSPAAATDVVDDRVYLVPYKWWKESQLSESSIIPGVLYTASSQNSSSYGMKIISNILFSSDLVFNLKKDDSGDLISNSDSEDGRVYALIPFDLWSKAIKWHDNVASDVMGMGADVYPLRLKISVLRETNIMTVRIGKRDNTADNYKRACKIFSVDSEVVRLWDFSGQTNLIFMNEWNRLTQDGQRQADQEIPLEIQVYAVSEILNSRNEGKKDDLTVQQCKVSSLTNGFGGISKAIGPLGLVGLENLGNTCFMNSAIQCLAHTPKLVDYFLRDYSKEINHHNPLGMDGEIAIAFGEVLRKLWSIERAPVVPRTFKTKLAHFAPQFSGFNQHDSQELLAFLLDGLHEDLNRVKAKPYKEVKDEDGRQDEEVADEYWSNHLARNDSIIVDLCQGQYRSTLVCPVCHKISVMFDPFMYLSLPLPSSTIRTMTITVFSTDGSAAPLSYTINVSKNGQCKDLLHTLSIACSLNDNESLLLAEVYSNRILRYLEDPSDSISLIRDGDRLAAYRLLKVNENLPLVVFTHQRTEHYFRSTKKPFGVPLIANLPNAATGHTIRDIFLKLMNLFLRSQGATSNVENNVANLSKDAKMGSSSNMIENEGTEDAAKHGDYVGCQFEFYLNVNDEKNHETRAKIEMDDLVSITGAQKQMHVLVSWEDKALEMYDTSLLISLPEIYKPGLFMKKPEPISLYACLEAFLNDEPLGPEDMWFCPGCKKHQQATKKLDLWRLPEILVIHLKRFSYSRFMKNKLDTFVDFPIHDLDLSEHIAYKTKQPSPRYSLYAISNHYGNMGGGHYTAYAYHEEANRWYDFDDRHVHPISDENSIKSSSAYVLFYRRIQSEDSSTKSTVQSEDSNTQSRNQSEYSNTQSMTQTEDTNAQSLTLTCNFSDRENSSE